MKFYEGKWDIKKFYVWKKLYMYIDLIICLLVLKECYLDNSGDYSLFIYMLLIKIIGWKLYYEYY